MSTSVPIPYSRSSGPAPAKRSVLALLAGPLKVAVVLLTGSALGFAATASALHRRFDPAAITLGSWTAWPKVGTTDIDPYAQAIYADTGQIALAAAEGLALTAMSDATGAALSVRCSYRIDGPFPATRYWTLTATTPAGALMDNPAGRSGFSSSEILRRDDGTFAIIAAPVVRPGNWLPLSGEGRFVLTLRLYDTPLASVVGQTIKTVLPPPMPLGCSS